MRDLAAEGLTMLVVTHEMAFARDVSNHVVFMRDGVIWEEGTPSRFLRTPRRRRPRSSSPAFVHTEKQRQRTCRRAGPFYSLWGTGGTQGRAPSSSSRRMSSQREVTPNFRNMF